MIETCHSSPLENGTLQTIKCRHSIRLFTEKSVSSAHITTILNAANQAPSAHNQQPWRFFVIRGKKKKALADFVASKSSEFPRPSSTLLRMASRSIASASTVVAVANTGELKKHQSALLEVDENMASDFFRIMEIQSSAAAVENLLLATTSLGLAGVWLGILFLIKNDVMQFLGQPAGEFMAVIPIGYPRKPSPGPKKRPLDTVVTYLQ
jgi:nitroreductase